MNEARIIIEMTGDENAKVDIQGVFSIQQASVALGKTMGLLLKDRKLSDGAVELAFAMMAQAASEILERDNIDEELLKRFANEMGGTSL